MNDEKLDCIKVTQQHADKLKRQALEFKKLIDNFQKRFQQDQNDQFYIMSLKWLNQWKEQVSYEELLANKNPNKYFGKLNLEHININLEDRVEKCFKYHPLKDHPWNTFMKENLQENVDYIIVDKEIWQFFTTYYHGTPIVRLSNGSGIEKTVAVNLLKFKTVLLYPVVIKQIAFDRFYKQTFDQEYLQVDRNMKLKDYYSLLSKTVTTFTGNFAKDNNVRIWRFQSDQKDIFKAFFADVQKQVGVLETNDEMSFDFNGDYIHYSIYDTIEDVGILDNHLIIIEFKDEVKPWCIRNKAVQVEGKCENCQIVKILNHPCVCRKVSYCSQDCKYKDYNYHSMRCEKFGSDDDTIRGLSQQPNSIAGLAGLSNLGNTCFMNSGTQCISNTVPLTEYFLSNQYFDEINMDNPIGTKGQLVKRVGALLKKLWYGEKQVVTPTNYKKAVGQFQPMFKGYHQHDSSELITFVLDGIHEDLNRVKKKPYVETKDSDERTDFVVAKESWSNHLARNQSIIVDLMYGQYKSTLKCPRCERLSITFDPYLMVQLGIPSQKKRTISFKYFYSFFNSTSKIIPFDKNKNISLKEYYQVLSEELKTKPQNLLGYIANQYTSFELLKESKSIIEIRKSAKRQQLCFRALTDEEAQTQNKFPVQFSNKYQDYQKMSYFQSGFFIFEGSTTRKQMHLKIFQYLQPLFAEYQNLDYEKNVFNKYYSLFYKSNSNYWNPCSYCQSKNCNDCEVKFDDEVLEETKSKVTASDTQCNFEVIILWKESPFKSVKISEIFNHYRNLNKIESNFLSKCNSRRTRIIKNSTPEPCVTLADCLQFSQQPEQLNSENTWYCKVCQEHVQAFKSMQIYKAPQILIFTLKRFKASNRMFKQKLEYLC
ncbi:unnamed protein product (macronuclear) [Paramecium tetraurelia]|uniref:ubiquitinyl hydrolase 1 n=1 Tax=Paramecium tetraurelia TaxID=5888 RepID=A0DHG3_PARTE|nr:uncharacterized protein GSPATT00016867001 [Paramecium tetraurelia]CAK82480.1 unnamed protein product [Paramecium tetraurelia]|eukprot:XP_001449877.1 hypothetical protein (macronuclear) [Paramecium tetraurelia strain d4-2]